MNNKQMVAWVIAMVVAVLILIGTVSDIIKARTGVSALQNQGLADDISTYVIVRELGAFVVELLVVALVAGLFIYLLRDKVAKHVPKGNRG